MLKLTCDDRDGGRRAVEQGDSFVVDYKDGAMRLSRLEQGNATVVGHFHAGWGRLVVGGHELHSPRIEQGGSPLELQIGNKTVVSDSFALGFDGGEPTVRADARRVARFEDGRWVSDVAADKSRAAVFQSLGAGRVRATRRGGKSKR